MAGRDGLGRGGAEHAGSAQAVALDQAERALDTLGRTVPWLLTAGRDAEPFRHYPAGDVYDFSSHAQFYYHTHRAGEHGHIHLFMRPAGMPMGLTPLVPGTDDDTPCHLVAVGFDAAGRAAELFTTNRWVTGEAWYSASAVAAMLPDFRIDLPGVHGIIGRWLTALVAYYAPAIADLAAEREAAVPLDRLDDESLEITSRIGL